MYVVSVVNRAENYRNTFCIVALVVKLQGINDEGHMLLHIKHIVRCLNYRCNIHVYTV